MTSISARLRRYAEQIQSHMGPPEMCPGPDADDLLEAADALEGLAEAERERDAAQDGLVRALRQRADMADEVERNRELVHSRDLPMSEQRDRATARAEAAEAKLSALQEEVGRLREALEPFAEIAELDIGEDEHDLDLFRPMATHNRGPLLRVGLFRRARSALARTAGGKDD